MNAKQLAEVESAAQAVWGLASNAGQVTGVSVRLTDGEAVFEVILDKRFDLTCKRLT